MLAFAKIAACSLTIGIGGSGGIFAPSLFIGATSGMAFGDVAHHIFGAAAGGPALYAVVAMGAVFASAARAPLTSLASVVEMTGDFALTLPVMLAGRHRRHHLPRAVLRHHLHHQAAAPRHRHRPHHPLARPVRPQGRRRHAPLPPAAAGTARRRR